jgi:hypothetical protein
MKQAACGGGEQAKAAWAAAVQAVALLMVGPQLLPGLGADTMVAQLQRIQATLQELPFEEGWMVLGSVEGPLEMCQEAVAAAKAATAAVVTDSEQGEEDSDEVDTYEDFSEDVEDEVEEETLEDVEAEETEQDACEPDLVKASSVATSAASSSRTSATLASNVASVTPIDLCPEEFWGPVSSWAELQFIPAWLPMRLTSERVPGQAEDTASPPALHVITSVKTLLAPPMDCKQSEVEGVPPTREVCTLKRPWWRRLAAWSCSCFGGSDGEERI